MKNHYVSRLILNRFSSKGRGEPLDYYDPQGQKKLARRKQAHKIFYKRDYFDDDVESEMNRLVEQPFSRLLDDKLLEKDEIRISRAELYLIKRFLIINSVKTQTYASFSQTMLDFEVCVDSFLRASVLPTYISQRLRELPKTRDMGWSERELMNNAMRLYVRADEPFKRFDDELCTRELFLWAWAMDGCYLTFCDSAQGEEFLLSSVGMITDCEPNFYTFKSRTDGRGPSWSKRAYMEARINDAAASDEEKCFLFEQMAFSTVTYENLNMFNLSATRSILLVSPFFKLYNGYLDFDDGKRKEIKIPDIWPSFLETREICRAPRVEYIIEGEASCDDAFIYSPIRLSPFDTVYFNWNILHTGMPFAISDGKKILSSLMTEMLYESTLLARRIGGINGIDGLLDLTDELELSKLYDEYATQNDGARVNPFAWLKKYGEYAMREAHRNPYVLRFWLENEEMVRTRDEIFGFMGSPDKRIELIKRDLELIEREENC